MMRISTLLFAVYIIVLCPIEKIAAQSFVNTGNVMSMAFNEPYLWCGTRSMGIIRYNVHDMSSETFTTADGLAGNVIEYICGAHDGRVWAGERSQSLSYFNGSSWEKMTFPRQDGESDYPVYRVTCSDIGRIYFSHIEEDFSWLGSGGEIVTEVCTRDGDEYEILEVKAAPDGNVYGWSRMGILTYKDGAWEELFVSDNRSLTMFCIEVDRDSRLWVGTNSFGVRVYDNGEWSSHDYGPYLNTVNRLVAGSDNTMWASTSGGIIHISDDGYVIYDKDDGLPTEFMEVMTVDDDGKPYAGYFWDNYGIYTLEGDVWTRITEEEGPLENEIHSVAVDSENRIWAGSAHGVSMYDGDTWKRWHHESHFDGAYVTSLAISPNDEVWAGTTAGIASFNNESWAVQAPWNSYIAVDSLKVFCVDSIDFDEDGLPWAATRGAGLFHYTGSIWEGMSFVQNDGSNDKVSVAVTHDNHVWHGTNSGLARYDGNIWLKPDLPDDWPKQYVYDLSVGNDSALWVAGYGVFARCDGAPWLSWTEFSEQLQKADINCLYGNSISDIWIGTSSGLYHCDGEELTRYTALDDHSVMHVHDICGAADGVLFATDSGILSYNTPFSAFREVAPMYLSVDDSEGEQLREIKTAVYPNPFNPRACIEFDLADYGHVTLDIFSVSGQKAVTLIDRSMSPGKHTAVFDGSGFASGIFFFRLTNRETVSTGRMVLMK